MYSKADFRQRFSSLDNDALADKLANQPLTEHAREAIVELLRERGVAGDDLERELREQRQDAYRRTGATNTCDACGKSTLVNGFVDEGQRFCSISCLERLRCLEASDALTPEQILQFALELRAGACPRCERRGSFVEARRHHWVWSAVVLCRWGHETRVCCASCGRRDNWEFILYAFLMGPWSLPGIFLTPLQVIRNLRELSRKEPSQPSGDLLVLARLKAGRMLGGRPNVHGLPF